MKTPDQLSALLGVCIVPQVIGRIKDLYGGDEQTAIREFYRSALFGKLQSPETGLWHLSAATLAGMFSDEVHGREIEYPEEQS
jgi:hypothetical protein